MVVSIDPRPLNFNERSILEKILTVDFEGAIELHNQLDFAEVEAQWGTNSISVDIRVSSHALRSALSSNIVPVDTPVLDDSGQICGEILVWVKSGYLAGLEYAWYGDEPPEKLPQLNNIVITIR